MSVSSGSHRLSNNSHDEIDERLKKKISELDDKHGLHLIERSNGELECVLRNKSEANRKLVMQAFRVPSSITQNKERRKFKRDELIDKFLIQRDTGFPLLRRSLMTPAEKKADTKQANAQHMAQVRAEEKAQIEHKWPTLDTPGWQVPGKHHSVEKHTDNPVAAVHLCHARTGCWVWWELNCLLAYIHVSNRLILKISDEVESAVEVARARAELSKLNGLLEMSVFRGETLLKVMETIFDGDDRRRADEYYRERGGLRGMRPDEEVLLDWFVNNDSISLDERKSKLPLPEDVALDKRKTRMESLVGLHLEVPNYWWPGRRGEKKWTCVIESINLQDDEERYFNLKCLGDPYPKDRYLMAYVDVQKYADREHTEFSDFYLPKTLDESRVDLEFKDRCKKTLQELRKLNSKIPLSMFVVCLPCSNFSFVC